ncbi:hypothetical protein SRL2020226_58380 [Mycobacterium kiyosense]|uniref:Uncharacterized protein n=1 Tax=Mycobacterium kiyosense TaxID=2871094 RepID=A0A9P3QBF8_9MYCO|nr:hypothetical protein SRL2020028_27550 [Mycobacterium kiyosense]GLB99062.1 hypothetical protein SRL2020226_58380 [Mycobacterium kiyosense]GLD33649.1 hypothetical protein Mkiyose1413_55320 [Mycobacterium kiyosense]GLD37224.1 hypothetical protein Mkiyose1595_34440 [Mycobacterium kiyosense]
MSTRLVIIAAGVGVVAFAAHSHPQPQQPARPPVPVPAVTQPTYDCHAGGDCYGIPCVRVNQDAEGNCQPGRGVVPYPPGDPRLGTPVNTTPAWPPPSPAPAPPTQPQRLVSDTRSNT